MMTTIVMSFVITVANPMEEKQNILYIYFYLFEFINQYYRMKRKEEP